MSTGQDCLVVGANGFLGSYLTDALIASGRSVRALDRFSEERVRFRECPGVELVKADLLNKAELREAVTGCKSVFHFVSFSSPATSPLDTTFELRTNVTSSVDLLTLCAEAGVQRFFFASSGGTVYGPSNRPSHLETDPLEPISPYGIGKVAIEHYMRYFQRQFGIQATSLRISNPYGARQHFRARQGLIPIVLRLINSGAPIQLYGDGSMIRDYVHVSDLMKMVMNIVDAETPNHRVYNLGSGKGNSVVEVLEVARKVTGTSFSIQKRETPPTFVHRAVLDISRFTAEWGPMHFVSLEDGMGELWEVIKNESR